MATVLWGARRGDVQYGSRAYWRTRIPFDPAVVSVAVTSSAWFDPFDMVVNTRTGETWKIEGMANGTLGCRPVQPG